MDVSVGTRLRVLRKDAGLTQAQLAALAGGHQPVRNRPGGGTLSYHGMVCHLF